MSTNALPSPLPSVTRGAPSASSDSPAGTSALLPASIVGLAAVS
jgi:hypothetical protein